MSKGRKRKDKERQLHPIQHCIEGRCTHEFYKRSKFFCRIFRQLIKNNKTPQSCYYYNHYLDR